MLSFPSKLNTGFAILSDLFRGWKTDRKIIVIESDDWGSSKIRDKNQYNKLIDLGYQLHKSNLCLDSFESADDLSLLFETLDSFRDVYGNPACITANMVVTNPDFKKIKESDYLNYSYLTTKDFCLQNNKEDVLSLWRKGNDSKIFIPQFHCREHFNWPDWLKALKSGSKESLFLFSERIVSLPRNISKESLFHEGPAYLGLDNSDLANQHYTQTIKDGLKIFKETFGFKSLSSIAPSYFLPEFIEETLFKCGVNFIQGSYIQYLGALNNRKYNFTGKQNAFKQIYLVRNCDFEQNHESSNKVNKCLKQIELAFAFKKPAILCSHRVNYIGSINKNNRELSLKMLRELLNAVMKKWPDVIFLSTPELGKIILDEISLKN